MMFTNEFFVVGNTAPNDDLVQLIDSFTGEAESVCNNHFIGHSLGVN